jgi:pyruvate ferredoxin oxidoreductase gamma subunit
MAEVRFHGLSGQEVMAAAELLAIAASVEGRHAQVLPGRETGEIVVRCVLDGHAPDVDALVITDRTLLTRPSTLADLRGDSYLLVNSGHQVENLPPQRAITVPATELARKLTGHPNPTAALLGALAALTGVVLLDSVLTAIRQWFGGPAGRAQATTALTTFGVVRTELEDLTAPATPVPQPTTR